MKAILVLCLLASISCGNVLTCLMQDPTIIKIAGEIISAVTQKEYQKIITILSENFFVIVQEVMKCLKNEDDDVVLMVSAPAGCKHPLLYKTCATPTIFVPDPSPSTCKILYC